MYLFIALTPLFILVLYKRSKSLIFQVRINNKEKLGTEILLFIVVNILIILLSCFTLNK